MISTAARGLEAASKSEPKVTVAVRLPLSLVVKLEAIAAQQRRSRMAIMRDAMLEYIAVRDDDSDSVVS